MNFDANDPRLTAYALGELDSADSSELEKLLDASPDARAMVDEIRETAALLSRELAAGNHDRLTNAQRRRIDSAAAPRRFRSWRRFALAASIVLLVGSVAVFLATPTLYQARELPREWPVSVQGPMPPSEPTTEMFAAASIEARPADATQIHVQSPGGPITISVPQFPGRGINLDGISEAALPTVPPAASPSTPDMWAVVRANNRTPKSFITPSSTATPDFAKDTTLHFDFFEEPSQRGHERAAGRHRQAIVAGLRPCVPAMTGDGAISGERGFNTESYDHITDNPFLAVKDSPLSTFSIDVDTTSYANVRRFIMAGQAPPKDAVRIEELLNYFTYDYPPPSGDQPFSANVEVAQCPWQPAHRLVRVGLRAKSFDERERPACNLVFLIDVSGSMEPANRLPLLKQSLALLVPKLGEKDRVAMVVYAGSSGLVLPSTPATYQSAILGAMENLRAGGSTNGGEGIELAYKTAAENFITGGVNRVILCTDGDFNVGVTNQGDLVRLIEQKAKGGVFLSVLGFGMGNLKDSTLEKLADKGNGNYGYIDTLSEARKLLVDQMGGTLVTIAKDVKIQIEFNPAVANSYRLIGYENRMLAAQDFNDDKKDAGEIGAGHTVTALYEVVPAGVEMTLPRVDPLKYQPQAAADPLARDSRVAPGTSGELLTLKLRYKAPDGDTSRLMEQAVIDPGAAFTSASPDFRFAAAVAAFGMSLRDSPHKAACNLSMAEELSMGALGEDRSGYRREFLELVRRARRVTQAGSTRGTPTDPPPVRFRNPQLESPTEAAPPGR